MSQPPARAASGVRTESQEKQDIAQMAALCNEVVRLRAVLEKYTYCRHGCIECFCTQEARAHLHHGRNK